MCVILKAVAWAAKKQKTTPRYIGHRGVTTPQYIRPFWIFNGSNFATPWCIDVQDTGEFWEVSFKI